MKRAEVGVKFNSISLEQSRSEGRANVAFGDSDVVTAVLELTIGRQLQLLWDIALVQGLSGNISRLTKSQQRSSQHPGKML